MRDTDRERELLERAGLAGGLRGTNEALAAFIEKREPRFVGR